MAPRELFLGISKGRLYELKGGAYGHTGVPVKRRGAGGEIIGGMLSVAGSQHGGMLQATGAGADWMKIAKKVAGVASPLSMLAGPEVLPVTAGLAAFAGSGKRKKKETARKAKKTAGVAAEIGKSCLIRRDTLRRATRFPKSGELCLVPAIRRKRPKTRSAISLRLQRYSVTRAAS